jgi:hypothetical protein
MTAQRRMQGGLSRLASGALEEPGAQHAAPLREILEPAGCLVAYWVSPTCMLWSTVRMG